jgi:hypothetical protein
MGRVLQFDVKDKIVVLADLSRPRVYHLNKNCSRISSPGAVLFMSLKELLELYPGIRPCRFCFRTHGNEIINLDNGRTKL